MTDRAQLAELRAVLAELDERKLLDRTQLVQCGPITIQLGPKPYEPPPLKHGEEPPEKQTQPSVSDLIYAASEGYDS